MNATEQHPDIVIVGAGPTGLTLAIGLLSEGFSPLVIDADPQAAHTSRAVVIHARSLEVLDTLGVAEPLLAQGLKAPVFRARDRDRVLLDVDFRHVPSRYNFTLMCPQDVTETVLRDQLTRLGGTVRRGVRATGLTVGPAGVTVDLDSGGVRSTVQTRYVVGADGGHSLVRASAGIPFDGGTYAQSFVLADVEMAWPLSREEVTLFFSDAGFMVVAPEPGDRFRIVATVDEAPERLSVTDVQALLDQRGPQKEPGRVRKVIWGSRFLIHHRVARSFRAGPIFLAGDAAHVHSPAGGQGMNTGIQDAVDLAAALARALKTGDLTGLEGYSDRRRPIARRVVTLADRMTRAATLRNPLARHARNSVLALIGHLPPVQNAIARNLAEVRRS